MSFNTVLFTDKGRALQSKAIAGATLNFTKIVMGSGSLGGQSQITLQSLIEPKVELNISEIIRNTSYATIRGVFNNADISTGFYWREIGVFAQDPDLGEILYCYGNAGSLAEYIPPQSSEIIEKVVALTVIVGNASTVTATINDTLVYATKEDVNRLGERLDIVDKGLVLYLGTTSGTANAYTIVSEDIKNLAEGAAVCVKFHTAASAASTLNINGWGAKAIKKAGGADVTNLKASMYTLRYDGTNFILQGEGASGNATASDLLLNKTATTDAGDITGVMPNNGAVNQSLPINGTYNIPAGYHNGSGKVTQSITSKSAATYAPGTSDQTIAAGQYLSGAQTIKATTGTAAAGDVLSGKTFNSANGIGLTGNMPNQGSKVITPGTANQAIAAGYHNGSGYVAGDPDLIPANILNTANIFGVQGSAQAGKKFASGIVTSGSDNGSFVVAWTGYSYTARKAIVSGLAFKPKVIILYDVTALEQTTIFNAYTSLDDGMIMFAQRPNGGSPFYNLFKLGSDAYVNSTGFSLPVSHASKNYYWYAYE